MQNMLRNTLTHICCSVDLVHVTSQVNSVHCEAYLLIFNLFYLKTSVDMQ